MGQIFGNSESIVKQGKNDEESRNGARNRKTMGVSGTKGNGTSQKLRSLFLGKSIFKIIFAL